MKTIQSSNTDSIDNYAIVEAPLPEPRRGEVRVQVEMCGIGYVDSLVALGRYQVKPKLPHTPGVEVAGVIDAMGEDVKAVAVGDRVLATVGGGFAEYALGSAQTVKRIPEMMSFAQAAGFQVNYVTAMHGLRDRGALKAGETLLVFGAAGGVGLAAVEVGKALGARVIGVASSEEKRQLVLDAGADLVIDREEDGWRDRLKALIPDGLDVVFDPACGALMEPAFRSLSWRGRYLIVGFVGGDIPSLRVNLPLMKGAALLGVDYRQFSQVFEPGEADAMLTDLLDLVASGKLAVPTGRVFDFEDYKQALTFALSGKGVSKTLLRIPSDGDAPQANDPNN